MNTIQLYSTHISHLESSRETSSRNLILMQEFFEVQFAQLDGSSAAWDRGLEEVDSLTINPWSTSRSRTAIVAECSRSHYNCSIYNHCLSWHIWTPSTIVIPLLVSCPSSSFQPHRQYVYIYIYIKWKTDPLDKWMLAFGFAEVPLSQLPACHHTWMLWSTTSTTTDHDMFDFQGSAGSARSARVWQCLARLASTFEISVLGLAVICRPGCLKWVLGCWISMDPRPLSPASRHISARLSAFWMFLVVALRAQKMYQELYCYTKLYSTFMEHCISFSRMSNDWSLASTCEFDEMRRRRSTASYRLLPIWVSFFFPVYRLHKYCQGHDNQTSAPHCNGRRPRKLPGTDHSAEACGSLL